MSDYNDEELKQIYALDGNKWKYYKNCMISKFPDYYIVRYVFTGKEKTNPETVTVRTITEHLNRIFNIKKSGEKMWEYRYFDEKTEKHWIFCTAFIPGRR